MVIVDTLLKPGTLKVLTHKINIGLVDDCYERILDTVDLDIIDGVWSSVQAVMDSGWLFSRAEHGRLFLRGDHCKRFLRRKK